MERKLPSWAKWQTKLKALAEVLSCFCFLVGDSDGDFAASTHLELHLLWALSLCGPCLCVVPVSFFLCLLLAPFSPALPPLCSLLLSSLLCGAWQEAAPLQPQ